MHIKISGICRGSEKIFALCSVPTLQEGAALSASAVTEDGRPVPCLVVPYEGDEEGESGTADAGASGVTQFVCIVPIVRTAHYKISVSAGGDSGELTLSSSRAAWESRLNYRMRPELSSRLRDYDKKATQHAARIEFSQCVGGAGANVLRGAVSVPLREDNDLEVTCFTQDLEPVPFDYVVMGTSVAQANPEAALRGAGAEPFEDRRVMQFSSRFPQTVQSYLFVVRDRNHPELDTFEVLFADWYRDLVEGTAEIMRHAQIDPGYQGWFDARRDSERALAAQAAYPFEERPTFSIVVPLFNTPAKFFSEMVESVRAQSYPEWELVLVNASPENAELAGLVAASAREDARIRVVALEENLGISENTNAGIAAATGDFVSFFDHDDVLEPSILFEYALAVNERPDTDLLYCDEDKLLPDGTLSQPFFKPDFSIDLLRNNNYVCHMLTVRRSLLQEIEPNTREYDGAQDHNLTLRASERARHVAHVARVLYHWRISPTSTAGNAGTKSYASEAGLRAVREHLERVGLPAEVSLADRPFTYRVIYDVPASRPLVSIVIPNKDHVDLLSRCVGSILEKSTYENYEIVVVENNSEDPATFACYEELEAAHPGVVRVVRWGAEFNFSKLMNFGRRNARGEYLLLLNNDTEVITPNWIEVMLGLAAREDVGVVGVRLFYPDDTIQHAGLTVTGGVAAHLHKDLPRGSWGYFALADAQQDLSAVTAACVMSSVRAFDAVGGFTEDLRVAFNDVDYCLKLREKGLLVVYTPEVELYHYESVSRGAEDSPEKIARFHGEIAYMNWRWSSIYINGDPYMSVNTQRVEPRNAYYHL